MTSPHDGPTESPAELPQDEAGESAVDLLRDLEGFREALCGCGAPPEAGPGLAFVAASEQSPGVLRLEPQGPIPLTVLEGGLGDARRLPRSGPGQPARVIFPDTLPADGEVGATVLAEVDDAGELAVHILLRRDQNSD